ncbi:MAG: hypothetical protein HFF08_10500 [Oscillospiraceae bacterium]|nr:hypothetical protein [Oscillospiraceae bacterium]
MEAPAGAGRGVKMAARWGRRERKIQRKVNIVFWFLIVIGLVFVWFCLSFAFKGIGSFGLKLFNDAKKEINGEEPKKSKECEDDLK